MTLAAKVFGESALPVLYEEAISELSQFLQLDSLLKEVRRWQNTSTFKSRVVSNGYKVRESADRSD